jgi:hypothetical protein
MSFYEDRFERGHRRHRDRYDFDFGCDFDYDFFPRYGCHRGYRSYDG